MNIKDIVLTCESDEPVAVRVDVSGPCDLTAGDFDWGADVECINPELHIATLSKTGRLGVDLTVQQGRGYLSSEHQIFQILTDHRMQLLNVIVLH